MDTHRGRRPARRVSFAATARALVLAPALLLACAGGYGEPAAPPVALRLHPLHILAQVARHMNVALDPSIDLPAIRLQSTTPLGRFQDAMGAQWGFRPPLFANAYSVDTNEIFLSDDAAYYTRVRRGLDESLAHEYAHYIQVRYLGADLSNGPWEQDAIAVQEWFRERHAAAPGIADRGS